MGLFDFVHNIGKKLFGSEDEAPEKIKAHIEEENPGITDLQVSVQDGVAMLSGEAESAAALEKAVLMAGKIRMRPIWVTDLTMMAGAFAILFDPIFQGMAISLLFGPIVAVPLTLIVVPLGCITAGGAFCAVGRKSETHPTAECEQA